MTPKQAANEILRLLAELEMLGGSSASPDLMKFLASLQARKERKVRLTGASDAAPKTSVAKRRVRDPAAMSKTIEELAAKLRTHFMSDAQFEVVMSEVANSNLSKDNVVQLYNAVFETDRKFGKSMTKPDLFNAIRRDRIARVRARS